MNILSICKKLIGSASMLLLALSIAQAQTVDRVVSFGGSLSDTGNAFYWLSEHPECGASQNVPPYDTLDEFLVPDGPYARGGHHFTNGATWIEGLTRRLHLAGNSRPFFGDSGDDASNYAVGGARAVANYPCRFNFPDQVDAYLGSPGLISPHTWITIEIGANDVRDALVAALSCLSTNPPCDPEQVIKSYITNALGSIGTEIGVLYSTGAMHFMIMNVPNIGLTPAVRNLDNYYNAQGTIIEQAKQVTESFNDGLAFLISQPPLNALDIKILDVYTKLNEVVAEPQKYGFVDTTHACVTPDQPPFICKKPDTYVFWDGIHPTKALHAIVAQQAYDLIPHQ